MPGEYRSALQRTLRCDLPPIGLAGGEMLQQSTAPTNLYLLHPSALCRAQGTRYWGTRYKGTVQVQSVAERQDLFEEKQR